MIRLWFFFTLMLFGIYSYGFVDLNLHLSVNQWYLTAQKPLSDVVFHAMPVAGTLFVLLMASLWAVYYFVLRSPQFADRLIAPLRLRWFLVMVSVVFVLSFPAFTYDMFNYITTAKVLYTHHENPYVVMPIDIPNEPNLAFTRAANKYALYGPTWLLVSAVPHFLGGENIWLTIVMFKAVTALFYLLMVWLIYRVTKNRAQVLFFALNPLVLVEVLMNGHNDIVMMVLGLAGLVLVTRGGSWGRVVGIILWLASVLVKGATIVLAPLILRQPKDTARIFVWAYWLMVFVFCLSPFREELYPWYAVWFVSVAALIPMGKRIGIHGLTVALTLGLSFRHLPYVLTREYGGAGPVQRILLTLMPVIAYLVWRIWRYGFRSTIASFRYEK